MANERLSMRKTREILRLKWELGRSHRDVAASLGVGLGTVSLALERAIAAELSWPTVAAMSEVELDRRLYRRNELPPGDRAAPAIQGPKLTAGHDSAVEHYCCQHNFSRERDQPAGKFSAKLV